MLVVTAASTARSSTFNLAARAESFQQRSASYTFLRQSVHVRKVSVYSFFFRFQQRVIAVSCPLLVRTASSALQTQAVDAGVKSADARDVRLGRCLGSALTSSLRKR
mmetsp:Transcript_11083/g.29759  ORF Transcript_11083/g.29759 Transcript_11083/m.29759 type:complete len:107 (+) Transcript_11083:831-1151(+)